jgi:glycerophosphoryl diester phosphodiesterase
MRVRLAAALTASLLLGPVAIPPVGPVGAAPETHDARPHLTPTLEARAVLSADYLAPGPPSGAATAPANGRTPPYAGQVIPGFSAMVDNGDGTFWAQPDNGFGTKANSADFLLRLYHVTPNWETGDGGAGQIDVGEFISLSDPDHQVPFPIVNEATPDRLLTGADFDIESLVRVPDGSFWIGEEFGPFLLHVNSTGKVIAPPVDFPDGKSPANPFLEPDEVPLVVGSRGFEAMAGSADGSTLYPIVEGALVDDTDKRRRVIYEFDTMTSTYTGRIWQYQTDQAVDVIGDAFMLGKNSIMIIERDDLQGPQSVIKRLYKIDLQRTDDEGFVRKDLILDALRIANPDQIGVAANPSAYGVADPFAFALQSFETALVLTDGRILLANDNNYPGSNGRVPGTPDDTEMVVIGFRAPEDDHQDDADDDWINWGSDREPIVIGHRGASGYRPEHTLAAYETALLMCADYIEPDLVSTKDGVLVARHENDITSTTDVATRPEFATLKTTKTVDGVVSTGWFTEDFTLAELKTLRAIERLPDVRPANTAFDGLYEIPTLDEVLDFARNSRTCDGDPVGVYPETKHPTYFDAAGLSLEEPLVAELERNGFSNRRSPVFIQSFETGNLKELNRMTTVPIVQLIGCTGAPWDLQTSGDPRTYADLLTAKGVKDIDRYADGIGACKDTLMNRDADGNLLSPTPVIRLAHRRGLIVHAYTFRRENQYLPPAFRSSSDPYATGDLVGEIQVYLDAGLDGFFTDNPDLGVAAVTATSEG